jgi:hypothetical protein
VFIRESGRWLDEVIRLAELATDILMDTGAVISAKPFRVCAPRARGTLHQPGTGVASRLELRIEERRRL